MKMNQILKSALAMLCVATLFTSCIEETFPEGGSATSGQIAESPFAAGGVVTAMSTILMTNMVGIDEHVDFGYAGIMGTLDRMAGEVFPVAGNLPGGNQYYDRWQWALYPGNSTGLDANGYGAPLLYYNYYQFIYTANEAISIFSQNESSAHELGMAYVYRAMSYLDMARLYDPLPAVSDPSCDNQYSVPNNILGLTVPIVKEGTTLEQLENNPRAPRNEMFAFILDDLNKAEELLQDHTPTTKGAPSLAVVYGLKARAYLWLGGITDTYEEIPTGAAAYSQAATYARKAIDESGCTIMTEAQYTDPKTGFNSINSSWMWALIQSKDTILSNLHAWICHMSIDAFYGYGNGSQPGISIFSYNRMADNDFRKKQFVNPERDWEAIAPYTNLTEDEFEGGGQAVAKIAPLANLKFHTANGEKFDNTTANVTDICLMRVEEMYLIEAEAKAHASATEGRALLESFMANRAPGYTAAGAKDIVEEIIFQKRMELWGEGLVFYDMKRLNISMKNGEEGTNAPSMSQISTNGRAPWWNCVIPLGAVQQNIALKDMNNPNATKTHKSVK